ncbi:MAG: M20/M25/M40 family metallo-hydrolase [Edaphobacter sp.]|uniref:M20/M25/M40 family metallo-hydrolase n=1 Tax=Edaphobacter sp. TaxID=1934404 RepID=UPI002388391D|nr:M20/M25/M40 family metallo-hydrolase [Edaphobacter sp.]MDE1178392.1 M20/M25/M40 family metallo-hydrolase [Edaphobacter sp.]
MSASTYQRITRLATMTAVHRAFYWLHLHQLQVRRWLLEAVRIPAPPFAEQERAAWFLERFRQLGLTHLHIDAEGNALGELTCEDAEPDSPVILISAHLDTVFPPGTDCEPVEDADSSRILGPGVCDNAAGLSALLALAAALQFARIHTPATILFAANVGEEGEGDLRGMRHLFTRGAYRGRIAAAIALEGSGTTAVVTSGLGSMRFRVTVTGPGGHSWSDAGAPNPILLLSTALSSIAELPLSVEPLTTLNVGYISGGTSVNSIPSSATALIELRSTSSPHMQETAARIRCILEETVAPYTGLSAPIILHIEAIGDRPAAALPKQSGLLTMLHAVDRHLNLSTEQRLGSTDANLPLSLGIPAIAIGTGGIGGSIHTLDEWYDPSGREIALRRILLLLLACTQIAPQLSLEAAAHDSGAAIQTTP